MPPLPPGAVYLTPEDVERAFAAGDVGGPMPPNAPPELIAELQEGLVGAMRYGLIIACRTANGYLAFTRTNG